MTHSFPLSIFLYRFHRFMSEDFFCASDISSSLKFVQEMTIDFLQTVYSIQYSRGLEWVFYGELGFEETDKGVTRAK